MSEENEDFKIDSIPKDMEIICQYILEKHLAEKKFDENEVKKWGNLIIDEIHQILSEKYPQYGYVIFFYMSEKTAFVSNHRSVYFEDTDARILVYYHTDDFYSEIRLLATKKSEPMENFLSMATNKQLFSEINQKISENLDGKTFNYELFENVIDNICKDINEVLLAKENKPCSFHTGYINKLPTKGIYFYNKFFNLELHPLFFRYENYSFICRIFLFIINN